MKRKLIYYLLALVIVISCEKENTPYRQYILAGKTDDDQLGCSTCSGGHVEQEIKGDF